MLFLMTKVAIHLISPLGVSLLLTLAAGVLAWRRWRKLGILLLGCSLVWLWLWSVPAFVDRLGVRMESAFPPVSVEKMAPADAIVLLGGGVRPTRPPRLLPEVRTTGARIFHAARLYKAGKAKWIVTTGGPGIGFEKDLETEAEATRTLLKELGVPEDALVIENQSRNTRENARFSKPLLDQHGCKKIILVTSALHMPRALREFRGICPEVVPGVTDYEFSTAIPGTVLDWVPNPITLEIGCRVFKEILGRCEQTVAFWFNPSPFG